jgi:hypothetical protein
MGSLVATFKEFCLSRDRWKIFLDAHIEPYGWHCATLEGFGSLLQISNLILTTPENLCFRELPNNCVFVNCVMQLPGVTCATFSSANYPV